VDTYGEDVIDSCPPKCDPNRDKRLYQAKLEKTTKQNGTTPDQ
jgi:hypothetical protein